MESGELLPPPLHLSQIHRLHSQAETGVSPVLSQCNIVISTSYPHTRYPTKKRYLTSELIKKSDATQQLSVFFESRMVVTEQFWEYGVMAYVAETGGFVGLFLGWSLLQLGDLVHFISKLKFSSDL